MKFNPPDIWTKKQVTEKPELLYVLASENSNHSTTEIKRFSTLKEAEKEGKRLSDEFEEIFDKFEETNDFSLLEKTPFGEGCFPFIVNIKTGRVWVLEGVPPWVDYGVMHLPPYSFKADDYWSL